MESNAKRSMSTSCVVPYSVVVVQGEVEICICGVVFGVAMLAKVKSALLLVLCPISAVNKHQKN